MEIAMCQPGLESILGARLRRRESVDCQSWHIWERKTLNLHRGVLHWQPVDESLSFETMSQCIRERVKETYRVSWWRGFGFGTLIESPVLPKDIAVIVSNIDTRANSKGTWQWTVIACPPTRIALGIHTWIEAYLSPVYRELIGHYESVGFQVASFKKEKDKFFEFIAAIARLKGQKLDEFEP
jgi:hypothetical protein